jgi:uncharacterized protein
MRSDVPTGIGLGLRAAFLDRLARGEAEGAISFVEISPENYMRRGGRVPRALENAAERHRVITHGLMMSLGGTDPFDPEYFATLKAFLDRHDPPWHSDHLCWSGLNGVLLHDLLPVPFTSRTAKRIAKRVREARDRLERPMAVENISWYMLAGASSLDETQFLGEILEEADCGLLLDVNNVFVNASNHGFDARAWLERIPLDRVWQLHIAGHERMLEQPDEADDGPSLIIDTHGADVRQEVRALLRWVIERTGPKPVLLERDSNIPPLARLLDEVRDLDRVYREALEVFETRHLGSPSKTEAAGHGR